MRRSQWLDELAELSAQYAPEGWEHRSVGDNQGAKICRYHRYDTASNADLFVEAIAITRSLSYDATVAICIWAESREAGCDFGKEVTLTCGNFPPRSQELGKHFQRAYREAERLNPVG